MNYINEDKNYMTDEERIRYLEESIRELRKEKEQLKKEKWEIRQRLLKLEKAQAELSRVKENKKLEGENRKLKSDLWTVIYERDNAFKKIKQLEERLDNKEKVNKSMRDEISKLKEERDFFKEQAILWRNDYKNEYEENRKLKYIIDTIMEKTCIDRITLASWEVFLNPSKRLKTSLEK